MTLARRLIISMGLLLAGLVLIGIAAVWGLRGLHDGIDRAADGLESLSGDLEATTEQIRMLRDAFEIAGHLESARSLLMVGQVRDPAIDRELAEGALRLQRFLERYGEVGELGSALHIMRQVIEQREAGGEARQRHAEAHIGQINRVLRAVGEVGEHTRAVIAEAEQASVQRRAESDRLRETARRQAQMALGTIAAVTVIAILGGAVVGTMLYRHIMHPLRRLQHEVRAVAAGQFDRRLEPTGDAELAELAGEFNRMSGQLDALYTDLETQVRHKSAELARSERLASVGFLAAGVAHEINNPLGIISGYAELSLRPLEKGQTPPRDELTQSLEIIRDEAFRCKAIIERLLLLARGGEEPRKPVTVGPLAEEVVAMARGLNVCEGRTVALEAAEPGAMALQVLGHHDPLKQVLLNLVVNALEATEPGRGEVTVRLSRGDATTAQADSRDGGGSGDDGGHANRGTVRIHVEDNGCGMEPEVLERAFEPFFTRRASQERRGVGLGLSISHALIEHMGGRLWAQSDGPGCGSVFTIELPEATDAEPDNR